MSARYRIEIDVRTINARRARREAEEMGPAFDKANRGARGLTASLGGLGKVVAVLGLAKLTGSLIRFATDSVAAFDAQRQSIAQLEASIASTGGAAGLTSQQLQQMASSIQANSTFGDELVVQAQAIGLTFTKITGEVFPRFIQSVADVSQKMGQDLNTTVVQLGKALNDPIANLGALSRTGIQFSKDQKEAIKAMVEMNDLAGAQSIILAELESQFGGSAKAASEEFGGQVKQLKNDLGDLVEEFGEVVAIVLGPFVGAAVDGVGSWKEAWLELKPAVFQVLSAILDRGIEVVNELLRLFNRFAVVGVQIASIVPGGDAVAFGLAGVVAEVNKSVRQNARLAKEISDNFSAAAERALVAQGAFASGEASSAVVAKNVTAAADEAERVARAFEGIQRIKFQEFDNVNLRETAINEQNRAEAERRREAQFILGALQDFTADVKRTETLVKNESLEASRAWVDAVQTGADVLSQSNNEWVRAVGQAANTFLRAVEQGASALQAAGAAAGQLAGQVLDSIADERAKDFQSKEARESAEVGLSLTKDTGQEQFEVGREVAFLFGKIIGDYFTGGLFGDAIGSVFDIAFQEGFKIEQERQPGQNSLDLLLGTGNFFENLVTNFSNIMTLGIDDLISDATGLGIQDIGQGDPFGPGGPFAPSTPFTNFDIGAENGVFTQVNLDENKRDVEELQGLGAQITDFLNGVVAALGGTVESIGNLNFFEEAGNIQVRVNEQVIGEFGSDLQAAVEFMITEALQIADISGIPDHLLTALRDSAAEAQANGDFAKFAREIGFLEFFNNFESAASKLGAQVQVSTQIVLEAAAAATKYGADMDAVRLIAEGAFAGLKDQILGPISQFLPDMTRWELIFAQVRNQAEAYNQALLEQIAALEAAGDNADILKEQLIDIAQIDAAEQQAKKQRNPGAASRREARERGREQIAKTLEQMSRQGLPEFDLALLELQDRLDAMRATATDVGFDLSLVEDAFARAGEELRSQFAAQASSDADSLLLDVLDLLGREEEAAQLRHDLMLAELKIREAELAIAVERGLLEAEIFDRISGLISEIPATLEGLNDDANDSTEIIGDLGTKFTDMLAAQEAETQRIAKERRDFNAQLDRIINQGSQSGGSSDRLDALNEQFEELFATAERLGLGVERVTEAWAAASDRLLSDILAPILSLRDEILAGGPGSLSSADLFSSLQDQFQQLSQAALGGDLDAVDDLPDVIQQFREAALDQLGGSGLGVIDEQILQVLDALGRGELVGNPADGTVRFEPGTLRNEFTGALAGTETGLRGIREEMRGLRGDISTLLRDRVQRVG